MFSIVMCEKNRAQAGRIRPPTLVLAAFVFLGLSRLLVGQVVDLRGDPINTFPVAKHAEAFHNEKTALGLSFKIYFPIDQDRYLPINELLAQQLSETPSVRSPESLKLQVVRTICTPRKLNLKDRGSVLTVAGGVVECDVEMVPESLLEPGSHEVILEFPRITKLFRDLDANGQAPPAEAKLTISVWSSREAKLGAEQRPERERQDQDREARESKLWLPQFAGIALALAISLVAVRYRKWLLPTIAVKVTAGQHLQIHRALKVQPGEEFSEPGTILQTAWARDRHGKTVRIKVETFIAGDGDERNVEQNTKIKAETHHEFGRGGNSSISRAENLRLDILVSVGKSVPAGTYLADGSNGSVKIKVINQRP